jgi:hypothetical protein
MSYPPLVSPEQPKSNNGAQNSSNNKIKTNPNAPDPQTLYTEFIQQQRKDCESKMQKLQQQTARNLARIAAKKSRFKSFLDDFKDLPKEQQVSIQQYQQRANTTPNSIEFSLPPGYGNTQEQDNTPLYPASSFVLFPAFDFSNVVPKKKPVHNGDKNRNKNKNTNRSHGEGGKLDVKATDMDVKMKRKRDWKSVSNDNNKKKRKH